MAYMSKKEKQQWLLDAHCRLVFTRNVMPLPEADIHFGNILFIYALHKADNNINYLMDLAVEYELLFDYGLWVKHPKADTGPYELPRKGSLLNPG